MQFNKHFFDMLRLAKLRGLEAARLGDGVYSVTSYSVPGRAYKVVGGVCPCKATVLCSHAALAYHRYIFDEASLTEFRAYAHAANVDFMEARLEATRKQSERLARDRVKWRRSNKDAPMPEGYECSFDAASQPLTHG